MLNPPPVPSGIVRSKIIFEEIIKRTPGPIDLNSQLEQQAGISLDSYVDLTMGALAAYMGRTPKQLSDDASLAVVNPRTFFGSSVPVETTERFWKMESRTIAELANTLAGPSELKPQKDFTALRMNIVVPVLVVQDNFVSSMFTVPWLAKSFRDLMRKESINRKVVWTSLLVLHAEDVESIQTYIKMGNFSVGECLLYAGKCGDPGSERLFEFSDLFRQFLTEKNVQPVKAGADRRFDEILNRVTLRLFNRKFEPLTQLGI